MPLTPTIEGGPTYTDGAATIWDYPRKDYWGVPRNEAGYWGGARDWRYEPRCMSLACENNGGCAPIGMTNTIPSQPIYPPDCATGYATGGGYQAHDPLPPNNGQPVTPPVTSANPLSGITSIFSGMSTTTLLLLGIGAYFLFFRKR